MREARFQFPALAGPLVAVFIFACSADFGKTDAGLDAGRDAGADELTRTYMQGSHGFCLTEGPVDRSCETPDDCIGYRDQIAVDCCSTVQIINPSGCSFANRTEFPNHPECTSDEACRRAPRACVQGKCVEDLAERGCQLDEECELVDSGCDCVPKAVSAPFDPVYGQDCTGLTACPEGSEVRCIEGYCLMFGSFMDEYIDGYCTCPLAEVNDIDKQECIAMFIADEYKLAAAAWPSMKAAALVEDCRDWMHGPLAELYRCLSVLCP
ncbi:MAG TPA: hypothetical protein VM425_14770 [Myxococcota bacterium]|nr:hypothetical protein [Myxococcota bacterium]